MWDGGKKATGSREEGCFKDQKHCRQGAETQTAAQRQTEMKVSAAELRATPSD